MKYFTPTVQRHGLTVNRHMFAFAAPPLFIAALKWATITSMLSKDPTINEFDEGGKNTCALCWAYESCVNCPVGERSGEPFCSHTPYIDFKDASYYRKPEDMLIAAIQEYVFLKSLIHDYNDWEEFVVGLVTEEQEHVKVANQAMADLVLRRKIS